jgi:hypothetical protein
MQSFIDRRAILSLKKRGMKSNDMFYGSQQSNNLKAITSPNSPRAFTKLVKRQDPSEKGRAQIDDLKIDNINIALADRLT